MLLMDQILEKLLLAIIKGSYLIRITQKGRIKRGAADQRCGRILADFDQKGL
jgi:hypothetical protein